MSTLEKRFESIDRLDNESVWPKTISRPTNDISHLYRRSVYLDTPSRFLKGAIVINVVHGIIEHSISREEGYRVKSHACVGRRKPLSWELGVMQRRRGTFSTEDSPSRGLSEAT